VWRLIKDIQESPFPPRSIKRANLYADEDIEDEVVSWLRTQGINIRSARELGHRGKPDSFHAAYAFKKKRFILTKNEKDYFDDRQFPPNRTYGVIVVQGDMRDPEAYFRSVWWTLALVPSGELYVGMKIRLTPTEVTMRFIDTNGQRQVYRVTQDRGSYYEWVDDT
jgi:hypothetical protein